MSTENALSSTNLHPFSKKFFLPTVPFHVSCRHRTHRLRRSSVSPARRPPFFGHGLEAWNLHFFAYVYPSAPAKGYPTRCGIVRRIVTYGPFIMPYRLRVVTSVYPSPPARAVKSDAASSETGQAVDGSLSGDLNSFLCHELLRRLRREPSTINNHRFKYSSSNSRAVDMLMDCTDPSFYVILRSRMLTIGSGLPDDEISQLPHLSLSHALPCR